MNQSHRRLVAAFLLLSMFFMSSIFAVQGALLSSMIEAFHLDGHSQGTASAVAFGGGVVALILAIFLQGKKRKRFLLKVAMGICIAGLTVLWLVSGYGGVVAAWGIIGLGLGFMDTVLSASMADLYTGDEGTKMMCMLHTVYGLGSVLTPMGYHSLLNTGMPWQQIYLVIGVCGLLLLVVSQMIRRQQRIIDMEQLSKASFSFKEAFAEIRAVGLTGLILAMLFHGVFLAGLNTWINRYADSLGGSVSIPAQSCLFAGIMLSRMLMPFLSIPTEKYVKSGGILGGIVLALGLSTGDPVLLRISLAISGFLFGALIPCMLSLGCSRETGNTMLVTTPMMLAMYIGQSLSSPLIASIEGLRGLKYGIILCVDCMVLCSLCNILTSRSGRRRRSDG